jgi:hypothetical protein
MIANNAAALNYVKSRKSKGVVWSCVPDEEMDLMIKIVNSDSVMIGDDVLVYDQKLKVFFATGVSPRQPILTESQSRSLIGGRK